MPLEKPGLDNSDQKKQEGQSQMRTTNQFKMMNMTGQSFNSVTNTKVLDEGGGQIRNITGTADQIKKHI